MEISDLIFDREKEAKKKKNIQRIKSLSLHERRKIDNPHLSTPSRIFNGL